MDRVILVEHNPTWVDEFEKAKKLLKSVFANCPAIIEHIGSTSLGIPAKPMVDIAVGVDDLSRVKHLDFKRLAENRYYRLKVEFADKIVIARFEDDDYQHKTHIVHVIEKGGLRWQELVVFRDVLKKDAKLLASYLKLKVQLAAQYPNDMNAYSEAKREFVHQCISEFR